METSFADARSLNSSDILNMPQLASSPSTKEDCVSDFFSGDNKFDSNNANLPDENLVLRTYSDTPCNTSSSNTISTLQINSSDSKKVKVGSLNSIDTQNNMKDNVKLCLEQYDPAMHLVNRNIKTKSNGCSSSTVSSCSMLATPACDRKSNQIKNFPMDEAQISAQKSNGTSQHQDKPQLDSTAVDTASKPESAQNNGELELGEVEDEAKVRMKLVSMSIVN